MILLEGEVGDSKAPGRGRWLENYCSQTPKIRLVVREVG